MINPHGVSTLCPRGRAHRSLRRLLCAECRTKQSATGANGLPAAGTLRERRRGRTSCRRASWRWSVSCSLSCSGTAASTCSATACVQRTVRHVTESGDPGKQSNAESGDPGKQSNAESKTRHMTSVGSVRGAGGARECLGVGLRELKVDPLDNVALLRARRPVSRPVSTAGRARAARPPPPPYCCPYPCPYRTLPLLTTANALPTAVARRAPSSCNPPPPPRAAIPPWCACPISTG